MSRPILSRPRTRVYGCNYDKGESYYKPMVDHLDRKYSGRPLFPESRTSLADEIAARRSDIGTRGLAESRNNSFDDLDTMFDYRGRPITEDNYEEDFVGAHRRFKERAAAAFDEDLAELRRKRKDIQDRMFDMVDMDAEIERAKATLGAADLAFGRHAAKFDNNEVAELQDDESMLQKITRSRKMKQADADEKSMGKSAPFKWTRVAQMEEDPYELKSVKARKARINSLIAENVITDAPFEIVEPKVKPRSAGKSDKRKKSVGF